MKKLQTQRSSLSRPATTFSSTELEMQPKSGERLRGRRFTARAPAILTLTASGTLLGTLLGVLLGTLGAPEVASAQAGRSQPEQIFDGVLAWPENQRAFVQDGPGYLLTREQRNELFDLDIAGRDQWIQNFLADPMPETEANELVDAIELRRAWVRRGLHSFQDIRARLLFLHGPPTDRYLVDCAETFKPMEIWRYGGTPGLEMDDKDIDGYLLILYQPQRERHFRMWLPLDSKRELYTEEMAYYLDQWEELKSRIRGGKRVDRTLCDDSEIVDRVTGIDSMFGFHPDRPRDSDFLPFLDPPDLAEWVRRTASAPPTGEEHMTGKLEVFFPKKDGQRMKTRIEVLLEDPSELEVFEEGELKQLRLVVDGTLEKYGRFFEDFRVRFQVPAPDDGQFDSAVVLQIERLLRPGRDFLMRLRVKDEISGKVLYAGQALRIPTEPSDRVRDPDQVVLAVGENVAATRIEGHDSLILVPPASDVVFGLWRAEALVTGTRIVRVKYFVDDQNIMSRKGPPFTAELRLADYPKEQIVRADGYDAAGEVVASDEVILNQPRGELRVRILDPKRGTRSNGEVAVSAEVVVPEEKSVEEVLIKVNENLIHTLTRPPWQATVDLSSTFGLTYITVSARLDDGLMAEDVRFVNAPEHLEEVDVNLVELYTTVTERTGGLVFGLEQSEFEVLEDGKPQTVAKFELVENLPLSLGLAVDVSGSMVESLGEAQRAAVGFLDKIMTPRDRCFAVAFADHPEVLMPRTSDVGAVADRLEGLAAYGSTSLYDAVVTSLYYFRGIRGRRALIILSDGADTSSRLEFEEALEYAKRSGVSIYAIGLRIGKADFSVRGKLDKLAQETGGRTIYIQEARDLSEAYGQIEKELRSQYLVAYNSNSERPKDQYREVEVEVRGGKLKARTISGYYP